MANDKKRVNGAPSHPAGFVSFPPLGRKRKDWDWRCFPDGRMKAPQDSGVCVRDGVPLWKFR